MRRFLSCLSGACALAVSSPASADWYAARSKHFIVYADEKPADLREFATRLERFDKAVRHARKMADPPVGDANRLSVFVLPSVSLVQQLAGDKSDFLQGFYKGRASGPVAFVPRHAGNGSGFDVNADIVFFHEYAHHLMFQMIDRPLPQWLVEGFAEFLSTVRFERDGTVGLGAPATHRAWGLFEGDKLSLETMLSGDYKSLTTGEEESLYGRGWLLVHYLTFDPSRAGQLDHYVDSLSKGVPSLDSARQAFGDLHRLDRDLTNYLNRRRLTYLKIGSAETQPGPIDVQRLPDGAAHVILLRAKSRNGVDNDTAEPLAAQIRAVEAKYPGDELVELTLAEAEMDSHHPANAEAAAERALKVNPRNGRALVFKGEALEAQARDMNGASAKSDYEEARRLFIAANKIDSEDPEPLIQYYQSYLKEGIRPTANAIAGFHYASDLAPQDGGLRMNSALLYLSDGKMADARSALIPIAYDPHGGNLASLARDSIQRIDAGQKASAILAAMSSRKNGN